VTDGDCWDNQERGYDIRKFSKSDLGRYYKRLEDQRCLTHYAGARGSYMGKDMIVPDQRANNFEEIMVNPVTAPTQNRHFFAGGADSISGGARPLTKADTFSRREVRLMKEFLEETDQPLEPIDLSPTDDPLRFDPMYVWYLTPRQWTSFKEDADGKTFEMLQAQAAANCSDKCAMQIWRGDAFVYEDILFKKMPYPIRFDRGFGVEVAERGNRQCFTTNEQKVAADADFMVERSLILGGQGLAMAFGNSAACVKSGVNNFGFKTESRDFDAKQATSIAWANGMKKLRFVDQDGEMTDRGVIAFDTAVPLRAGELND
jgi:hypothetical protein